MHIGHIEELWRYPVKSMAGESISSGLIDPLGMVGDRAWAMINKETGDVAWGKSFPALMNLKASYLEAHPGTRVFGSSVPPVSVTFPDGRCVEHPAQLDAAISEAAGTSLHLNPLEPPENTGHYRWRKPMDGQTVMKILGINEGESPPDMSIYGELLETLSGYYSPPGTYYDMAPLHLVTSASVRHMESISGETFSIRRFRPNLYIRTSDDLEGLVEFDWTGQLLKVGDTRLKVAFKTVRCSMPARPQHSYGLEQNPQIAKSLYETTGRFFGAYLSVVDGGRISVGDPVSIEPA